MNTNVEKHINASLVNEFAEVSTTELERIHGGMGNFMWMLAGVIAGYAFPALAGAIGGAAGAASVWNEQNPVGTVNPTGNEMYPYSDPCL